MIRRPNTASPTSAKPGSDWVATFASQQRKTNTFRSWNGVAYDAWGSSGGGRREDGQGFGRSSGVNCRVLLQSHRQPRPCFEQRTRGPETIAEQESAYVLITLTGAQTKKPAVSQARRPAGPHTSREPVDNAASVCHHTNVRSGRLRVRGKSLLTRLLTRNQVAA